MSPDADPAETRPREALLAIARERLADVHCVQGFGVGEDEDGEPQLVVLVADAACTEVIRPLLEGLPWSAVEAGQLSAQDRRPREGDS